ncbi:MAG: mRNA 3'-end processing factor [Candidatus Nitrosocaldaceae archaeon]|nr:MAG: mRNA 3'-end processing factor [Candidatus Nitrosocaldaceae archaeon]
MKVTILGAAREVGRSAILVDCDGTRLLLDYGVLLKREPLFPMHVKPRDIDAVLITHAHLDHSGFVPSLFLSGSTNVYATEPTLELSRLLIEDMLKISGFYMPFEYLELLTMLKYSKPIDYRVSIPIKDVEARLYESGHVLGGSTIIVEYNNKRIFYTGDINTKGTRVLRGADLDIGDIDLVITESTYSMEEHQPREEAEEGLIEFANDVIERGGVLFIPAFSVERAQEIACVFQYHNFRYRIVMDGMALKANEIMLKYPKFMRDAELFRRAINNADWIRGWSERKKAIKEPCVVISPAGMLVGGASIFYLEQLANDTKNGIAVVSYQGEGTPGRALIDERVAIIKGKIRKVNAEIRQFDFSGHSGRHELFDMLKSIKGNPKVLTIHGDGDACIKFAEEIRSIIGLEAHAPVTGESIEI